MQTTLAIQHLKEGVIWKQKILSDSEYCKLFNFVIISQWEQILEVYKYEM